MPWGKRRENGKWCVYKKTTGKTLHCYDNEGDANDYLAALHMHAHKEAELVVDTDYSDLFVSKEDDGSYRIVAVSTAALKDREGETFDVQAIDYDKEFAERTGNYPEFRVFHKKPLGVGRVEKMSRVGIFAVDEGHSYTDPFSLQVCEKMLMNNQGKWKTSRGFMVIEASGMCPNCDEGLVLRQKHMIAGFRCPTCNSTYLDYKGVLKEVHFLKAKTFDITITDIPAVPWTGVAAFRDNSILEESMLTKKQLKEKLLAAGIDEEVVDARISKVSEAQLKEYDDIPMAVLLKELEVEPAPEQPSDDTPSDDGDEEYFVLDEDVLKEFADVMDERLAAKLPELIGAQMKEAMNGFEITISDLGGLEVDFKEAPAMVALEEKVVALDEKLSSLKEAIDLLLEKDETRLKEMLDEMPRSAKLRVRRSKDLDDDVDDTPPARRNNNGKDAVIVTGDGHEFGSMTEFIAPGGD